MKIWIDLTNSPHVNFFKPFIEDWKAEGHEVIITCRDLANTIDLIEQNRWEYSEVGRHAGKNLLNKLLYFPKRIYTLVKYLNKQKPDVAISQSSYYSPLTAFFLRIPSIYLNDNEYAKGNYVAFLFAFRVILPEYLEGKYNWLSRVKRIDFYPGIKEGIYLSQSSVKKATGSSNKKPDQVYFRPEPWLAQYYKGDRFFFDQLLEECADLYEVVVLPRGEAQAAHYRNSQNYNIKIMDRTLPLNEIVDSCALFIGAGGTMTRELAFLGIPTISIYQDELLEVDRYLIQNGAMIHDKNLTVDKIEQLLEQKQEKPQNNDLISKGELAFVMIKESVYEYKNQKRT